MLLCVNYHCSLCSNHCEAAKILIEAGSDVNAKGETGLTPVHIAAALGYSRLLKLLLDNPSCKVDARVSITTHQALPPSGCIYFTVHDEKALRMHVF